MERLELFRNDTSVHVLREFVGFKPRGGNQVDEDSGDQLCCWPD